MEAQPPCIARALRRCPNAHESRWWAGRAGGRCHALLPEVTPPPSPREEGGKRSCDIKDRAVQRVENAPGTEAATGILLANPAEPGPEPAVSAPRPSAKGGWQTRAAGSASGPSSCPPATQPPPHGSVRSVRACGCPGQAARTLQLGLGTAAGIARCEAGGASSSCAWAPGCRNQLHRASETRAAKLHLSPQLQRGSSSCWRAVGPKTEKRLGTQPPDPEPEHSPPGRLAPGDLLWV